MHEQPFHPSDTQPPLADQAVQPESVMPMELDIMLDSDEYKRIARAVNENKLRDAIIKKREAVEYLDRLRGLSREIEIREAEVISLRDQMTSFSEQRLVLHQQVIGWHKAVSFKTAKDEDGSRPPVSTTMKTGAGIEEFREECDYLQMQEYELIPKIAATEMILDELHVDLTENSVYEAGARELIDKANKRLLRYRQAADDEEESLESPLPLPIIQDQDVSQFSFHSEPVSTQEVTLVDEQYAESVSAESVERTIGIFAIAAALPPTNPPSLGRPSRRRFGMR